MYLLLEAYLISEPLIKYSCSYTFDQNNSNKQKNVKKRPHTTPCNTHGHKFLCKSNFNGNFAVKQNQHVCHRSLYLLHDTCRISQNCIFHLSVYFSTNIESKNSCAVCHAIMNMQASQMKTRSIIILYILCPFVRLLYAFRWWNSIEHIVISMIFHTRCPRNWTPVYWFRYCRVNTKIQFDYYGRYYATSFVHC